MAGLTAARSLANFFERIIVLENDALPKEPGHRPGTPQCRQIHVLLAGGLKALDSLFPDFKEGLARAGAVPLRMGYDYRVERPGYDPFPQRDLGILVYSMTRPLLEFTVRQRLGEYRNVEVRERCVAQEFIPAPGNEAIAAVRYQPSGGTTEILPADLVIDSSGHGRLTLALLHSIGRPLPEETSIGVDMGYATALFDISEVDLPDCKGVFTFPEYPRNNRAALVLLVEGNCWIVSFGGRRQAASGVRRILNVRTTVAHSHGLQCNPPCKAPLGDCALRLPSKPLAAFRAPGKVPNRAAPLRRRYLPFQSYLRPGNKCGCAGGGCFARVV